jgi:hypothetical protein
MRHDYDLPQDWPAMTPEERHEWMVRERCRRQAIRQETVYADFLEAMRERHHHRLEARPDTWDVDR